MGGSQDASSNETALEEDEGITLGLRPGAPQTRSQKEFVSKWLEDSKNAGPADRENKPREDGLYLVDIDGYYIVNFL